MKFGFIETHRVLWPLRPMCRVLGVSKSGFLAWRHRPPSPRARVNEALSQRIVAVHHRSRQTYGSTRVREVLRQQDGHQVSRHRVARLMAEAGIRSVHKPKFVVTTQSQHAHSVPGNVLDRDFAPGAINERIVTDITYIDTREGWLYLAAVMDLGSRRIIGWSMKPTMDVTLVIDALHMARTNRPHLLGAVHHSDRGSQYACETYRRCVGMMQMQPSMSRTGCCWDNAAMESFFHTLKVELVHRQRFETRDEARKAIFEYIEGFYNRERLHSALGYLSPEAYERQLTPVN